MIQSDSSTLLVRSAAVVNLAASLLSGCADPAQPSARRLDPIIYGADHRREYFEVTDVAARATIAGAVVAFIPRSALTTTPSGTPLSAPSLREREQLCDNERFGTQPAAAFCSGVLVDDDLVLTAGHCLHQLPLEQFAVVFDYFYSAPNVLTLTNEAVYSPTEIVAEALPRPGDTLRLDYGWLRVRRNARDERRPARLPQVESMRALDSVVVVSAGGGIPLKVDAGATVRDARLVPGDYFLLDSDTLHGSSGGPAFNSNWELLGVFNRGDSDWVDTAAGCRVSRTATDANAPQEEFLHARRAVEALCGASVTSALCDCEASDCSSKDAVRRSSTGSGCTVSRGMPTGTLVSAFAALALAFLARRLKATRAPSAHLPARAASCRAKLGNLQIEFRH